MGMQTMLDEEIKRELEVLKTLDPGEENHKTAVGSLAQLMDRAIELKKVDATAYESEIAREVELDLKRKQMQDDKKDRVIKYVMTGVKDTAIIVITIWGTVASINFEREGTITTSAGRKHLNKLLSWFK